MAQSGMDKILEGLKQERDELRLKLHLAKADAKDEWAKLEERWEQIEGRLDEQADKLEDDLEDASERLEARLKEAADDLKTRYAQFRDRL
ncbi:MAG: hypothetical protein AAGI71_16650 [Bacteroidota bacterium]